MNLRKIHNEYYKYGDYDNDIIIIDCIYDNCWICNDIDIIVSLNNKEDHIDIHGKLLTNFKYDKLTYFSGGFSIVSLNNRYGYIDKQGVEVVPCEYDVELECDIMLEKYKLNLKRIEKLKTIV